MLGIETCRDPEGGVVLVIVLAYCVSCGAGVWAAVSLCCCVFQLAG